MMQSSLILEGGGMRGVFTAGVLDCFIDHKLHFDHVVGVSAGSCLACSFLSGQRGRGYHAMADYMGDDRYCSVKSLITTGDLFNADFSYKRIPNEIFPYDYATYDHCGTDFHVVVTDCRTGLPVYHKMGDLHTDIDWIQASSSLPMVSRPVFINGNPYLDGGLADSIPIAFSQNLGYPKQVVILTRPQGYRKKANKAMPLINLQYRHLPGVPKASAERHINYNASLELVEAAEKAGTAFVIRPGSDLTVGRLEKNKAVLEASYNKGYEEAERLLPQLQRFLAETPIIR